MNDSDDTNLSSNQEDIVAIAKPGRYLCPDCGQSSLIPGSCPNCGKPMIPDTEELPGEKKIEDDEVHDELKPDTLPAEPMDTINEPEKYSQKELDEVDAIDPKDLIAGDDQ